jgi:hypothetical protein
MSETNDIAADIMAFCETGLEEFTQGIPPEKRRPIFRLGGHLEIGALLSCEKTSLDGVLGYLVGARIVSGKRLLERLRVGASFELLDGPNSFAKGTVVEVSNVTSIDV